MTKSEYRTATAKLELKIIDWLEILPCYYEDGKAIRIKPVPIVMFPFAKLEALTKRINEAGFHFAWSTVHYSYLPKGYETKALIKNGEN